MYIDSFQDLLRKALPKRKRILAVGKVGVGKTDSFRTVSEELGMDFIPICAPLQSPVKIGGYPRPPVTPDGDATHALFDGIARAMRATKPTVLVFDDLGMAGGETLKAIVDVVQFGRIDNRTLPDCVVVAGATNDVGHGADVQGLIEPLKTRWHSIVNVETSIDAVVAHGLARGWPADLLAYLRNDPQSLHDHKPSKSMSIDGACPRGWSYVAGWINDDIDDPEVIAGCVGKGAATKYLAFRGLIGQLPDIDQILIDPAGSTVPENPSAQLLVSMTLAHRMTAGNFGRIMIYLQKLGAPMRAYCVRDAFRAETARTREKTLPKDWKPLAGSRDFAAWAVSADGKDVMMAGQ